MRRIMLLAGAAFSPASMLCAQTTPAPTPAPAAVPAPGPAPANTPAATSSAQAGSSDDQEIVVRAQPDQRTSIDRDTYVVRDTAEARTSNAIDILSRIPAVTVQPDNSVRVLGTSGVQVLIDGRPSPNPNILRDLQGSEIARIEVVTNPSAQFSASGTGGIINIVTRRNSRDGLSGAVTASVGRHGNLDLRASPTFTSGDWTISGNLGLARGLFIGNSMRQREALDPGNQAFDTTETSNSRGRYRFGYGSGQLVYRPTEKRTFTLQGTLFGSGVRSSGTTEIISAANPGLPLDQVTSGDAHSQGYNTSFEYREEGARPAELLTASIQQSRYDFDSDNVTDSGPAIGLFRNRADGFTRQRMFKLDYVRPLGGNRRLLVGGQVNESHEFNFFEQSGELPLGSNPFPPATRFDGSTLEVASYVSLQVPLLGGTLLSGLRIENRNYDFADPSLGEGPSDGHLFPSFTLERRLARWLTGTLSYSARVRWPSIEQLTPALRFSDSTTASTGNPALQPELTDSVQARFRAEVERQTILLTLFNRDTDNLFSTLSTLTADGVLLSRPVNIGTRLDRGGNLAVQGTIARGLTYNFNANVADRRITREDLGTRRLLNSTTYGGGLVIDYRDGNDGRRGADHIMLSINYSGPYDDGLTRTSSRFQANASWSHAITDRLTAVVSVDDIFGPTEFRSTAISGNVISRSSFFSDAPRYKFALTYNLGGPGQPQPQGSAAPPVPVPGAQ